MNRCILIYVAGIFLLACTSTDQDKPVNEPASQTTHQDSTQLEDISIEDFESLVKNLEDPERVNWQNPQMVLDKMGDLSGKTIADIGVGTGYFAFRILREGGRVIGIDIEQKFIDYIEERKSDLPEELSENLITRLTVPDDPAIGPEEADWVLIVNTFYILNNRISYLKKIRQGLKPGGKLIVVDFKTGDMPIGPPDIEKVSVEQAASLIRSAGFNILESDQGSLQYQYILVAQK